MNSTSRVETRGRVWGGAGDVLLYDYMFGVTLHAQIKHPNYSTRMGFQPLLAITF